MAYTTINKHTAHFNTKLYTGNDGTHAITGVGFQPDWVWLKPRNANDNHRLMDSVIGAGYYLVSNATSGQTATGSDFASFDSDGFTLGGSDGGWNSSSYNYVAWNWKANGSGSSNGNGSVTSTVSVNTTAGFSIVKWTGTGATATVGHGLGVKPSIVLIKNTGATENWVMYHGALGAEKNLKLNNQETAQDTTGAFNDTEPTSSVFTVHTNTNVNQNGQVMIAYCFAEKTGYSKFGSYNGNSSAEGAFIYTGFKPAFINIKASSRQESWYMFDNKRVGRNPDNEQLYSDATSAEATTDYIDILSNGFKLRQNNVGLNGSGETYVYLAYGQSLVGSNNIPATAR